MFKDLDPFEEGVVGRFLDVDFFSELMTVPRMGRAMHQQAMSSLLQHWELTRDGYFSMFGAFAAAKSIEMPAYDHEKNLQRGTRALKQFRLMQCPSVTSEVTPWLWLGISVLIYAHCGLGNSGTTVRRYILQHLLELRQQGQDYTSHPGVISLIALDIFECLIHRRMPVLNMPLRQNVGADAFLGVCAPLVRLCCDLATLSYNWQDGNFDEDVLAGFEAAVDCWQPTLSPDWYEEASKIETTHVLSQIRVHRAMLLLFAHRLRHAFGREDAAASQMAHSILSELDLATIATRQPPMWTMSPFIVAALEVPDTNERSKVVRNVPKYGDKLSPKSQRMAADFLRAFWTYRDQHDGFRWIDMLHYFPPLCLYM
ncbi:hypothetical protein M409DRAFT_27097 [Zasmidium cellare ATCC 36951]|uniref:Transcription factor domain-containing protein n=1 Tax=Zasmidium cellare ATCC 36951 TaxID=1080233 RepID=A0A6A6C989_ZASCE|nr:uncharacterized protein M409DRAFT_27097 [Zasmidium cellare ATCC 36951]KAF2162472.1 hypothetical protein M409DRAFT_27097 [Zasmidium cellare ATCC 36951]